MRSTWLVVATLAGCSSHPSSGGGVDAAIATSDRCVTQSYNASGVVDERATQSYDSGHIVSTDWEEPLSNDTVSWSYRYDGQGRPELAHLLSGTQDVTATYSSDQVIVANPADLATYVFSLHDGKVVHSEGPTEQSVDVRDFQDLTYDASGRLVTLAATVPVIGPDSVGPTRTTTWSYDSQSRIASVVVSDGTTPETFTFTYTTTPDGWSVRRDGSQLASEIATFAFDGQGRLVRAAIDEDGDTHDDWVATYVYDDAASTMDAVDLRPATNAVGRHWHTEGRCDAPSIATQPAMVVPMTVPQIGLAVPTPGYDLLSF